MGKRKDSKRKPAKAAVKVKAPSNPRRRSGPVRAVAVTVGAVILLAGAVYVLRGNLLSSPPYSKVLARVQLTGPPKWMPPDIAHGVLADVQSAAAGRAVFDEDLARDVYLQAAANPWIARVGLVRKHGDGTVLVEADYRRPLALVRAPQTVGDRPVVVSADAVVLPLPDHRIKPNSLVTIGDVQSPPPPPGRKWEAPDLADGLRLLKLIQPMPFAAEITVIDVRNHRGRISPAEPHLRMYAQVGRGRRTDIRFGRFPAGDDYCVSPDRKLAYLSKYYKDNGGRLAGVNSYLDLRYDQLHVSHN